MAHSKDKYSQVSNHQYPRLGKISFNFVPIPTYFWKYGWFDNPKMMIFILWCFHRCSAENRVVSHLAEDVQLDPFEFIFSRSMCSKETGLTDKEIRIFLELLMGLSKKGQQKGLEKGQQIITKTASKRASKYSVYKWSTEYFSENKGQQKGQQNFEKMEAKGPAKGPAISSAYMYKEERRSEEAFSLEKESDKEKESASLIAISPFLEKNKQEEQMQEIEEIIKANALNISKITLNRWLKKFDVQRILENLKLLMQRGKIAVHEAWMEKALIKDFAGEQKRIANNLRFAQEIKEISSWTSLTITKDYCRDELYAKEYYFKLPQQQFQEMLYRASENKRANEIKHGVL